MSDTVKAVMNYTAPMQTRPRYHANDQSKDVIDLDPQYVTFIDGRREPPSLDHEGFTLIPHRSKVSDFRAVQSQDIYKQEIENLLYDLTGADVIAINSPGIFRFSEKAVESGKLDNSRPARFIHVDINDETARSFYKASAPVGEKIKRATHYNVWRAITPPPQDVPLALCDARSVANKDLIEADAIFDQEGQPDWSFTGLVTRFSPTHRWVWFPDMTVNEALVFVTNESDLTRPHCVPHSAFDNPFRQPDTPPRISIEMRAIAYWLD